MDEDEKEREKERKKERQTYSDGTVLTKKENEPKPFSSFSSHEDEGREVSKRNENETRGKRQGERETQKDSLHNIPQ